MNAAAENLLRAGKWQEFNQQFGGAAVDLSNANLQKADLSQARLVGANLDRADLSGAHLKGTDLRRSSLRGTILDRTTFSHANLGQANLVDIQANDVTMDQCSLGAVNLSRVAGARWKLTFCTLRGAALDAVSLTEGHFDTVNFSECTGTRLHLHGAIANRTDLAKSKLAHLEWAIIAGDGLDLDEAELGRFTANKVLLRAVMMRGTRVGELAGHESALVESELIGARVERMRFTRCMIGRTLVRHTTLLALDLSGSELMEVAFDRCTIAKLDAEAAKFVNCRVARSTANFGTHAALLVAGKLELEENSGFSALQKGIIAPNTRIFVDGKRV